MHVFITRFHPRLDEALYRLAEEAEYHSYALVAQEELRELSEEAAALGLSADQFGAVCVHVSQNPWRGEEGEVYIETDEGRRRYEGEFRHVIGPGQLPQDDPQSINFLRKMSQL